MPELSDSVPGYAPQDWDPLTVPTPAQWARWFTACSPEVQEGIARRVLSAFAEAETCFVQDHVGNIKSLRELQGIAGHLSELGAVLSEHLAQEER